jgi:NADH dehydrogenase/NADH:ubiquinone oxidoreductase subunit G
MAVNTFVTDSQDASPLIRVLELCDRQGIKIPRLCHHPGLTRRASCRICLVECNGKWFSPSCVTTVCDDLSIATNSKPVQTVVRCNLLLLLESHDECCTSCVANAGCVTYGAATSVRELAAPAAID